MGRTSAVVALTTMALVGALTALAYWVSLGNAPKSLETAYDRMARTLTGHDPMTRCWASMGIVEGSIDELYYITGERDRDCYLAPRTFNGIFIAEFEGDAFLEDALPSQNYVVSVCEAPWLHFDSQTQGIDRISSMRRGSRNQIWHLQFVGRPSPAFDSIPLTLRYGHFGMSERAIIVDRIIAARLLRTYEGYGSSGENAFIERHFPEVSCDNPR